MLISLLQVIISTVVFPGDSASSDQREQGKKYCETLPAPFERHDSEFSGGMPIEKTNIESLNLPCHNGIHIIKA